MFFVSVWCVCLHVRSVLNHERACDKLPPQDRELIFKREEEFSDPKGTMQRPEIERKLFSKALRHQPSQKQIMDSENGELKDQTSARSKPYIPYHSGCVTQVKWF